MKRAAFATTPRLLLAGLLALLVFGNCGGGVRGFLTKMGPARQQRLRQIIEQESRDYQAARVLSGAARHAARARTEATANARLDSLLTYRPDRRKMKRRWNKVERQLRRLPPAPATNPAR